ncbi:hypothetical protein OKA05_02360 [Luteolibacter arcticus]|uniref:Tfp pilus assembly protein PilX n=1 Tax=Luteolibacter arcticus TaxID=1581411 RepID=A0ABT3GCL9_9BACT|nr:hypothetical protein [Luteolibacter arcticus]MCW1921377.1 hypothetical protein [Luteolibacter arcticus]
MSLSLMVLLTVLAIGLLSLSTIGMRSASHGEAMAVARSNARMALALAIGELQKQTGPDQRITTTADQLAEGGDGDTSAAAEGRRHWTGVYDAWDTSSTTRPTPTFRRWLVSGDPANLSSIEEAKGTSSNGTTELVGEGTLGAAIDHRVVAPLVIGEKSGGIQGRHAWWVGDQGVKAALAHPELTEPADLAATRQTLLSSPRNAVEWASTADSKPFAALTGNDARSTKVTGWQQAAFLADKPQSPRPLFHDLAASSSGLLTNVRGGGFRKDLSFHLEKPQSSAPQNALYTVGGQKGINEAELWLYYNSWKEFKTGTRAAYTTGGSIGNKTPYLQVAENLSSLNTDPENLFKQPTYINVQTVLSFHARSVKNAAGQTVNRLALVVDPIVALWNPLDVPVVVTPAYNSVKFWQLPYDLKITRPSGAMTVSLKNIVGSHNYLTLTVGKAKPLAMRPGEVVLISQGPNTAIKNFNPGLNYIDGEAGWNNGGGIAIDIKDSTGKFIETAGSETIRYEVTPNSEQSQGTATWFLTANDWFYKEDRTSLGESAGLGGVMIDGKDGLPAERITAAQKPEFFSKIQPSDTRPLTFSQLAGRKEPIMVFSYGVKTELGADRTGRFLTRFNPKAPRIDFQTLTSDEMEVMPYEVHIEPLNSWKNRNFEVSLNGGGYFGGGWTRDIGTGSVTTHTIPREPIHSLAAFQHAFANGFTGSTSGLFSSTPLLPQISHAIGNSAAPSVIPAEKTSSSLGGPRPLADHSYLANQALWDDWFLSGIAPQTAPAFSNKRPQKQVATEFLNGEKPLPNSRYQPALAGQQPDEVLALLFSGNNPSAAAAQKIAALLSVDGMFNVNSTSVEAWKTLLGGLKQRPVSVRGSTGSEERKDSTDVPVVSLFGPEDKLADGEDADDILDAAQWTGRRELTEKEIDLLAQAIVREVRKRGPFLSLADFVNRRPGSDKSLARSGTIQSALDSKDVSINEAYNTGSRAANPGGQGRGYAFPEAENGPAAYGIPGVVKQADILTPIAPYLSARSDTFMIRAYGDCLDGEGKILARVWCEAEVQRGADFVDPADEPTKVIAQLQPVNQSFGRRYRVTSFRWLHRDEV